MNTRQLKDKIISQIMGMLCLLVLVLIFFIAFGLYQRARPVLEENNLLKLLFSSAWHPTKGEFGLASFIVGTAWVTIIALVISFPLSLLTAIYLSEYCPKRLREFFKPIIDLLAGISPVVYGLWGVIVIVPFVRDHLMPFLSERFSFFPFVSENYTGFSVISASIVLAVMISPLMMAVMEEVMTSVSFGVREASLSLGATRWETTKKVVLKKARPGIMAAVILGLSRAIGETMAVLMVAGCALQASLHSIFDPAYPLPALIANTYGEMMSIPLYDAAVLLAALILLGMTVFFNAAGWGILFYLERNEA